MGLINKMIGMPELASEHGELVDLMLEVVHWIMLVLFVGWTAFLIYVWIRYHKRNNKKANYYGVTGHATMHIEIGVVIVEAALLIGFAYPLWSARVDDFPTGDDVVRLRAVGEKFQWNFHYPGADGKFGLIDHYLIDGQNVVGIDPDDPNGKDDFVTRNDMRIPIGRNVIVEISSKDVIHNLALGPMRISHDAIPGDQFHMWFKPTKLSPKGGEESWDIICGQLCGPGHAAMRAGLYVTTEDKFQSWLKENAPAPPVPAAPDAADEPAAPEAASSGGPARPPAA